MSHTALNGSEHDPELPGFAIEEGFEDFAASADPTMATFVRALLPPAQAEEVLGGFYTDAFHASLLQRLSALRDGPRPGADPGCRPGRWKVAALPKWKLRQVAAHVDANIDERITLADLAAVAGLSAMHFAAQFKVATGQRPHDYVTHRRIQRARQMLGETREPLVQVALAVGFQTQAHFTTVFRRIVGSTPKRWRLAQMERMQEERAARPAMRTSPSSLVLPSVAVMDLAARGSQASRSVHAAG